MKVIQWILGLVPPPWWSWRVWRVLNPIHFVLAIPYAAAFARCGFWSVNVQLLIIGVTHELGDGDFDRSKVPTAPYEGLKDTWSFVVGGLIYFGLRRLL